MDVKIGIQNAARELNVDTPLSADEIEKAVADAMAGGVLSLTDGKGRRVVVPGDKLAYVEIATSITGQVGFKA